MATVLHSLKIMNERLKSEAKVELSVTPNSYLLQLTYGDGSAPSTYQYADRVAAKEAYYREALELWEAHGTHGQ